jgi:DNA-binding NarL/FixJ family response regulator
VAAAEDAASLRSIVSALRAGQVRVVGQLDALDELATRAWECDAVVVSVDLGAPSSARAIRELLKPLGPAATIVVSRSVAPIGIRRALDAGVNGVVLEKDVARALVPTLLSVASGQITVPRQAGPQLEGPVLTFREREVLRMVALGFKNSEIGQKLFLAESTVKSHLSSAFTKLGVRSRSEAAALILDSHAVGEILRIAPDK